MRREEAIEIYKQRAAKFINTRSTLWKFNIAVWTVIALAIQFKNQLGFTINSTILPGIILAICHFVFSLLIQLSLESDKAVLDNITEGLNVGNDPNLNIQVNTRAVPATYSWKFYVWVVLQEAITFFLLYILWNLPASNQIPKALGML